MASQETYGEACLEFLRAFDTYDHDPSRTTGDINDFVKVQGTLFTTEYAIAEFRSDEDGNYDIPGLGIRKKLTQTAYEGVSEPLLIGCAMR